MGGSVQSWVLVCLLAVAFCCRDVNGFPIPLKKVVKKSVDVAGLKAASNKTSVDVGSNAVSPSADVTLGEVTNWNHSGSLKKRDVDEKDASPESNQGPKNIILIMSSSLANVDQNATEDKRNVLYDQLPVKRLIQDRMKRSPEEPLLMISPVLLPETYSSTHSCKAAVDSSLSALIEWARSKCQLATGVLAASNVAIENPSASIWQKKTRQSHHPAEDSSVAKDKEQEAEKKENVDEVPSSPIGPINDAFQKIDIEDKGSGILYKKVDIGGPKKNDEAKEKDEKIKDAKMEAKRDGAVVNETSSTTTSSADVKVTKRAETTGSGESSWDLLRAVNRIRRTFFDRFLRGLGFGGVAADDDESTPSSPLVGMVESTLHDLQTDGAEKGYLMVVSGGDETELNDIVKLVKGKTSPADTLLVVTGMCRPQDTPEENSNFWQFDPANQPVFSMEQQRLVERKRSDSTQIPLYASGPKSELLADVEALWDVPQAIRNLAQPLPTTGSPQRYHSSIGVEDNTDESKSLNDNGLNPYTFFAIDRSVNTEKTDIEDNSIPKSSDEGSKRDAENVSKLTYPKKTVDDDTPRVAIVADWNRMSAQNVRERALRQFREDDSKPYETHLQGKVVPWFEEYGDLKRDDVESDEERVVQPTEEDKAAVDALIKRAAEGGVASIYACALLVTACVALNGVQFTV